MPFLRLRLDDDAPAARRLEALVALPLPLARPALWRPGAADPGRAYSGGRRPSADPADGGRGAGTRAGTAAAAGARCRGADQRGALPGGRLRAAAAAQPGGAGAVFPRRGAGAAGPALCAAPAPVAFGVVDVVERVGQREIVAVEVAQRVGAGVRRGPAHVPEDAGRRGRAGADQPVAAVLGRAEHQGGRRQQVERAGDMGGRHGGDVAADDQHGGGRVAWSSRRAMRAPRSPAPWPMRGRSGGKSGDTASSGVTARVSDQRGWPVSFASVAASVAR